MSSWREEMRAAGLADGNENRLLPTIPESVLGQGYDDDELVREYMSGWNDAPGLDRSTPDWIRDIVRGGSRREGRSSRRRGRAYYADDLGDIYGGDDGCPCGYCNGGGSGPGRRPRRRRRQ